MKEDNINTYFFNKSIKNGNPNAYTKLFEKHYEDLFNFINFYTNDSDHTKDIVQETFVKLWEKRSFIQEDMSILSFLYKISYNIFIDKYRRNKREKASLDAFAYERLMNLIKEDDSEKTQLIENVKTAVNELPNRCREIFEMSKFKGYKYAEIADTLSISIKTVEVQMGRAFSRIRSKLNIKK